MGGMGPQMVVEGDPAADTCPRLRSGFPGVQVDAFVFPRPAETLDKDVVEVPGFAVHGDFGLGPLQSVGPVEGRELTALDGVHDLGRAELVDRLVQRLKAELGFKRVRYPPGQNLAGEPVHDGHQIQEPFAHRQIGDVIAPDLICPINAQPAQRVRVGQAQRRRS